MAMPTMPSFATGAGSAFEGSSAATIGDTATGRQTFGSVRFGSSGLDSRWLVWGVLLVAILVFVFLMWG